MVLTFLQVALGGAIGASARFATNVMSLRVFGPAFPAATMIVNVVGSFLMGVLVCVLALKGGAKAAPFLMTGLLGGFTTFSAFSLDAITIWERGEAALAAGYVAASVVLSLAAIALGLFLGRSLLA